MAPDGERTLRKTSSSSSSSSTTICSLGTTKAITPSTKTVVPKQSRHTICTMAAEGGRTLKKISPPLSLSAIYSLGATKAGKPVGKTVVANKSRQISLQQQQRQRQQQRLQQIRAIRKKRTVAFAVNREEAFDAVCERTTRLRLENRFGIQEDEDAVKRRTVEFGIVVDAHNFCCPNQENHEILSQPHTSVRVVSAEVADAQKLNSSSVEESVSNNTLVNDIINSRVSCVIRDSTSTFQQNASDFGEVYHDVVKDMKRREQEPLTLAQTAHTKTIRESIADLPNRHQRSDANRKVSLKNEDKNENDHDVKVKPKQSNVYNNGLVVNVQNAEAAAAAISKHMILTTSSSCDGCHPAPAPVTPTSLSPFFHESNCATANTSTKRRRIGRPSKKLRSCSIQEQDAPSSLSCLRCLVCTEKLSRKPKMKRVRYDMECVPSVEINKDLWQDLGQSMKSSLLKRKCNDNTDSKQRSASNELVTTIPPDNQNNNINNLAQSPSSNSLLYGSVLWIPSSRKEWDDCVNEMKAVCTSASFRRWSKGVMNEYEENISNNRDAIMTSNSLSSSPPSSTTPSSFQPPLSQAFIKDRVQIDDPLRGYQIRHAKGGWLQGFLVWTNFTVWTQDFQWNSNHPSSGLLHHDTELEGCSVTDDDGTLSTELQALPRGAQDPLDGGIVLKQVAEISLLGGFGCGKILLRKAIEDIRKSKDNSNYKYVVLQATEGSRSFYEKMGFVRVGAVCRYRWAEYNTSKNGSDSAMTGKKPGLKKAEAMDIELKSTFDPPSTFHGYRHWTYTNESAFSLDAHGGPSVMMCLKLENMQHQHQQTLSELLKPLIVAEKPVIRLFGNVSNPESENVAPTRKSKRRSVSTSSLRGMQQQQQQDEDNKNVSHRPHLIGVAGSGRLAIAAPTTRRTSNRSKRGRNKALADCGYILYGVEGGRNCSNKNIVNASTCSGSRTKRQRRSTKLSRIGLLETTEESINEAVIVPSAIGEGYLGNGSSHQEVSSIIYRGGISAATGLASSLASPTNNSLPLTKKKPSVERPLQGKAFDPNNAPHRNQESSVTSISVDSILAFVHNNPNVNASRIRKRKSSYPPSPTVTARKQDAKSVNSTTTDTVSPGFADLLVDVDTNTVQQTCIARGTPTAARSLPTTTLPRKRSRQPATAIHKLKLFKQKVSRTVSTNANFYNKVVVRRNVRSVLDKFHGRDIGKRSSSNESSKKGRIRLRYNGGLMIDHRYEFCYYFVLHYNESKESLTIVPMVKDGVFELATGRKSESANSTFLAKGLLGRPRYECNILETDKNWIRDAPLEDYAIVQGAIAVVDTPLLAQEAWDIVSDPIVPCV